MTVNKHDFENGKYTLIQYGNRGVEAHRYGEPWREFIGDKFIGDLVDEFFAMKGKLDRVQKYAEEREAYGKMNRTVHSARIGADLLYILNGVEDE